MTTRNNNSDITRKIGELTEDEEAVVFGTLLGDGHIQLREQKSYRLKIAHSTKQTELVMWKRRKLERLCQTTQEPAIGT